MDVNRRNKSGSISTGTEELVRVRERIIYLALWLLLLASIWNGFNNHNVDNNQQQFFQDVRDFMERGGRFTADDGLALQSQIDDLKAQIEELKDED